MTTVAYSKAKVPPIPAVALVLQTPDGSRTAPGLLGYLDTAADCTVIPLDVLHQLGLAPIRQVAAHGFGAAPIRLDVYEVRLQIAGVIDFIVNAIGHSAEPYVLVGRDVLNQLRITFDGPNSVTEFH